MEVHTTTALERKQIAAAKEATLNSASLGILGLRGKYVPSDNRINGHTAGTVHLHRDTVRPVQTAGSHEEQHADRLHTHSEAPYVDKEGTTLCILAVPSYMTPSDLLGWFRQGTLEQVSNVRLVKTSRSDRYMALLKFIDAASAELKHKEWTGKPFKPMERDTCHVVFVGTICFDSTSAKRDPARLPHRTSDPFVPTASWYTGHDEDASHSSGPAQSSAAAKSSSATTSSAISAELPVCPVCLERMDDTTGLATIFCQHVFHCACLQKWQGSGCPVCRYTHDDFFSGTGGAADEDQCKVCGLTDNLWVCLTCGNLGCGRYDDAHAFAHFEQTAHAFAMDVKTQAIWDYVNDDWVHRLIQKKANAKLEDSSATSKKHESNGLAEEQMFKESLEDLSFEYASMLKVQLDSQRAFYEEQVEQAIARAMQATTKADHVTAASLKATERLEATEASHQILLNETLPDLERSKERSERRAEKFEALARKMEKEWKEKEVINESLMDRISHVEKQLNEASLKNSELEEQNRDLSFFISGMEKLKDQGADVQEGTLQVAEAPKKKKGKGKK